MSRLETPPDHVTPYDRFAWSDTVVEHLLVSGEHQRELIAYFGEAEYNVLAPLARQAAATAKTADAPHVFIVPGIMGSQLGLLRPAPLPHDVLWIDPVDISIGNLSLLKLPGEAKIVSLGVVLFTYLRLKLHLRIAGFAPVFYDYDWRLGVDDVGRALAERVRAASGPVMIVAHSMGGLVSRAALACDGMKKVERVVLLGTPNSGSYAPVQALRGVYAVVRKIARLAAPDQSAEALAADVFSTFPSLYHLLPPPGFDSALDFFDESAWPASGPQPHAALLANARTLSERLASPDSRFTNVVGVGQETVTRVSPQKDGFVYTITRHGDGTVPLACAALPGAQTYYTKVAHSDLARDADVAQAIADVLRTGATQRLETKWSRGGNAEARISDRELRRTHTEKVDWVHLEPVARQDFLRNLNDPPHLKLRVPGKPIAEKESEAEEDFEAGLQARRSTEAFDTEALQKRRCKRQTSEGDTPSAFKGAKEAHHPAQAQMTTLVWFRQDLRLKDNPALHAAAKRNGAVIPIYIWSPEDDGEWPLGAASRWWLHQSLKALDASLRERGSKLVLAKGRAEKVLARLVEKTNATAVYWNRRYEPAARECSTAVKQSLRKRGIEPESFNSTLLAEPHEILNQSGLPYRVYTPYMRRLLHDLDPPEPLAVPSKLSAPKPWPDTLALDDLGLMPDIAWYTTMAKVWEPGEAGASKRLSWFLKQALANYSEARERPAERGTSGLSPHLHFGEVGPRQIWHALGQKGRTSQYLREIIWREFAHHLLYHFPDTTKKPLRPEFENFPWKRNAKYLRAWQRGRTGVPMVDAGMRELWATGVMHNRVRMVVGSFLVKNLLQTWQEGTRWFWDTLVDADLAANTMNWQWVAGSGADAAPYFRIFNPQTQGERFDPEGTYVRKWVPELAKVPAKNIHAPRENAIVDLAESREAALDAYKAMRAP